MDANTRKVLEDCRIHIDKCQRRPQPVSAPWLLERIDAALAAPDDAGEALAPDGYVVLDEDGYPIHSALWSESCHEHINEAINGFGIEHSKKWIVRPYWLASPPPAATPQEGQGK